MMSVRASAKIHPRHPASLPKKDQSFDLPSYGHPNHKEVVMAFAKFHFAKESKNSMLCFL